MLAILAACSDGTVAPRAIGTTPVKLVIISGNAQTGAPGVELPNALVAKVVDATGKGLKDQIVNFRVVAGGGSMFAGASISDKDGLVKDYWTLGPSGTQTVEARAVDPATGAKLIFGTFTATVTVPPPVDGDGDGYLVSAGDCNDANAAIHPGAADDPDPSFVDANCDGIDGTKTAAVFVAKTGVDDAGCGDFATPCLSIGQGQTRAVALSRSQVFIGVGTYSEVVQLVSGVNLFGGYSTNFASRSLFDRALINGSAEHAAGIRYTVLGEGITQPTSFIALMVQGGNATGTLADGSGKSSAAVLLRSNTANVTISYARIIAANGAAGSSGAGGTSATQTAAADGGAGGPADSFVVSCDNTSRGAGGAGAGAGTMHGGGGGAGGTMDTGCDFSSTFPFLPEFDFTARAGSAGSSAATVFSLEGTPGAGGAPCVSGQPGRDGRHIISGSSGPGGSATPSVVSGFARAASGLDGALGADGGGGGGGGGSGGCDPGTDSYGAGGGGGGAGGLRAPGAGDGGHGGGVSVGVYLSAATATLSNLDITRGAGGHGGVGGFGGQGQPGGTGGPGGSGAGGSGAGGQGGDGSRGGYSGAGGGGSGGLSAGILKVAGAVTTESGINVAAGTGGTGGVGGQRGDFTTGGTGAAGVLATSMTIP